MPKTAPTVYEVAQRSGVSIATVSRVLRGVGQVAPGTRKRVLAAVDELGYRPSHLGRALVAQSHAALGIVFPGLSGPYYSEVINGFESEAVAARKSVLILGTHLLKESEELVLEMSSRVDGMAILCGTCSDDTVRQLVQRGTPIVLMARHPIDAVPTVRVDNVTPTIELTLHLLRDHGYRGLQFVGNPEGSHDITDRWRAFVQAHRQAGITPPAEPIRVGQDQHHGLLAANQVLSWRKPPRALVCSNDETALGVYSAATTRGVSVPHELAVTGWDDISMAALLTPGLTTVRQPIQRLGSETARRLLALIAGQTDEPADLLLPTELLIRSSCGCPEPVARSSLN